LNVPTIPARAALPLLATVLFTPALLLDARTSPAIMALANGPLRGSLVVVWGRMGGRWIRETARTLRRLVETTHPPQHPHAMPVLAAMSLLWAALGGARARAAGGAPRLGGV
jgi:hypothetical protein